MTWKGRHPAGLSVLNTPFPALIVIARNAKQSGKETVCETDRFVVALLMTKENVSTVIASPR